MAMSETIYDYNVRRMCNKAERIEYFIVLQLGDDVGK